MTKSKMEKRLDDILKEHTDSDVEWLVAEVRQLRVKLDIIATSVGFTSPITSWSIQYSAGEPVSCFTCHEPVTGPE